jgi:tetratricopeptide (TPR) repeat protein
MPRPELAVTALLTLSLAATADAHADCAAQARQHRIAAQLPQAQQAAERCLQENPNDIDAIGELSRAVGLQGRHGDALALAERALALAPQDLDLRAWRVRLLAWAERTPEAWRAANAELPPVEAAVQGGDPELARLLCDLALWVGEHEEAARRYGLVLARWPDDHRARLGRARAWEALGRRELARADHRQLCAEGDQGACAWVERERRRDLTWQARVSAAWIALSQDRPDWSELDLGFDATLDQRLRLGFEGRWLRRDFGEGGVHDGYFEGQVGWRAPRWSVSGSVGGTPASAFYPSLTAAIEPEVALGAGLSASARLWRLQFEDGGATVLSPGVSWEGAGLRLGARAWLGLDDQRAWNGAGAAQAGVALREDLAVWGGLGLGSGTDYLQLRRAGEVTGFGLLLAGGSWQVTWRHQVRLDYALRLEQAARSTLQLHQLSLSYITTL